MSAKRVFAGVASVTVGGLLALAFSAVLPDMVLADSEVPTVPLFEGGLWSEGTVVVICFVALVAIIVGVALLWRARQKRRASGPNAGR